jgi:hypothetical protein
MSLELLLLFFFFFFFFLCVCVSRSVLFDCREKKLGNEKEKKKLARFYANSLNFQEYCRDFSFQNFD